MFEELIDAIETESKKISEPKVKANTTIARYKSEANSRYKMTLNSILEFVNCMDTD